MKSAIKNCIKKHPNIIKNQNSEFKVSLINAIVQSVDNDYLVEEQTCFALVKTLLHEQRHVCKNKIIKDWQTV